MSKLQMIGRSIASTIMVLSAVLLGACSDPIVRADVGETKFCVPRDDHVSTDYWWIPADLPEGGFRFVIPDFFKKNPQLKPARDVVGRTLPLRGLVTANEPYFHMSRPRAGSYLFKQAQKPIAAAERLGGQYVIIYDAPQKDSWNVWAVPDAEAQRAEDAVVADVGTLVARCREYGSTTPNTRPITSCSRVVVADKVAIDYNFSYENLDQLTLFDSAVSKSVLSWKCAPTN